MTQVLASIDELAERSAEVNERCDSEDQPVILKRPLLGKYLQSLHLRVLIAGRSGVHLNSLGRTLPMAHQFAWRARQMMMQNKTVPTMIPSDPMIKGGSAPRPFSSNASPISMIGV